jgi:Predicted membrane protein/domain
MSQTIETKKAPLTNQYQQAGFGIRFFAYLLDQIIILIITLSLTYSFSTINHDGNHLNLFTIIELLFSIFYFIFFWVKEGTTPGKKLFKLKIVKENFQEDDLKKGLSFSTAITRYIGYVISGFIFSLGYLWIAFDKNKQGWHDKIAGTIVIKLDNKKRIGLKILVLLLTFISLIFTIVYGLYIGIKEINKKEKSLLFKKIFFNKNKDLNFSFKKEQENYLSQLPQDSKTLIEKSRQLVSEAIDLIAGADCNVQKLNKEIEKKLSEAVILAQKATEISPDNPYTHYNLAYTYNWSLCYPFGGDDKALLEYQKAVKIDPNFIQAKLKLGKIYINLENYQSAIPYLEEVVNKIPLCGTCWLDLGEAYLRYGAKTKAKEALETAKYLLNKDNKNLLKIEKLLDELNNK